MIPFAPLLATALACAEAEDLINGVKRNRDISSEDKLSLVEVIKINTDACFEDANADWRNGFNPPYLEVNPMAQVTYRGVTYNTENRPNKTVRPAEHVESYRGVKFLVDSQGHKRVLSAVW